MSTTTLTVAVDVRHPHVWFGFEATRALARRHNLTVRWQPLRMRTLAAPVDPGADADRGARHSYLRALDFDRNLNRYAGALGLPLVHPYRNVDGLASAAALLWLHEHAPDAAESWLAAVLRGYWSGEFDITDASELTMQLERVGAPVDGFASWLQSEGAAQLDAHEDQQRAAGLFDVPGYLLDDEPFIGRQHLPMLDWLLGGRTGPPPI